jgi:hypothetical protein
MAVSAIESEAERGVEKSPPPKDAPASVSSDVSVGIVAGPATGLVRISGIRAATVVKVLEE